MRLHMDYLYSPVMNDILFYAGCLFGLTIDSRVLSFSWLLMLSTTKCLMLIVMLLLFMLCWPMYAWFVISIDRRQIDPR